MLKLDFPSHWRFSGSPPPRNVRLLLYVTSGCVSTLWWSTADEARGAKHNASLVHIQLAFASKTLSLTESHSSTVLYQLLHDDSLGKASRRPTKGQESNNNDSLYLGCCWSSSVAALTTTSSSNAFRDALFISCSTGKKLLFNSSCNFLRSLLTNK